MGLENVGSRVIWARTQKGWNSSQLIERSGVPQGTISKLERGDQSNLGKWGPRIAEATGVTLDWLATGKGKPYETDSAVSLQNSYVINMTDSLSKEVLIRQYKDIRWAVDAGLSSERSKELESLAFNQSYMSRNGLNADTCIACPIYGDSMSPTINDGDTVLINREEFDLFANNGHIFAFAFGEVCRIIRVYTTITGDIRLVSDNPNKNDHPDEIIKPQDIGLLNIVGRVRWSGGDK